MNNIFKSYDIRGIYPEELDENTAFKIGRAFVGFIKKFSDKKEKLTIAVGRDNRKSSFSLSESLIKGIIEEGADVIDLGMVTTPVFYFAVVHYNLKGGLQVTASHNPPQYNGFKLVREKAVPISGETGIEEIKKIVVKGDFLKSGHDKGIITKKDVVFDYITDVFKNTSSDKIFPFKIVIDTANAVPGLITPKIFKNTSLKVYNLFEELDGSFPNHLPDPQIEENLRFLKNKVLEKKADLGIAFDGDGDRIFFTTEKGEVIRADLITALMSKIILKENPGVKILYDIRASNIIKETVEKFNGKALMGRVGHSFIKEKMRKEDIFFAGEVSGHYYLKENFFCESPFFVIFKILEEMTKQKKPISELINPFKKYYHSGELNFKVKNKEKIIKEIEEFYFQKGKVNKMDGLRIDFKDWWFNVRLSNTEPLLRLVLEAKERKLLEEKSREIKNFISRGFSI